MHPAINPLIGLLAAGTFSAQAADCFINLGTGTMYSGTLSSSGFSLAAPQWAGESVFNRTASFSPNDPFYSSQWNLTAANVQGAWNLGYSGAGVTIGLVDDGVQANHPDLRVSTSDSYNFVGNNSDPSPTLADQNHGTAVAGVAAAIGNNGTGVIGPAYNASVAGLKVGFDESGTSQQFADATLYHSSGSERTIKVKNHSYGISSPYVDDAGTLAETAALNQSAAAGTLHVLAAGNEGGDANWKRLQATDKAIVVSATADDGTAAYYSNVGANVTVTAPSSGGAQSITTTDRTGSDGYNEGDTTSTFGGTSAAAPLVAGIMALGVEANPNMDVRTAKHLLAMTSSKIDAGNAYWSQNAAGVNFNPFYGFGMIDAGAFVAAAEVFTGVTERVIGTADLTPDGGQVIADRPDDGSWLWGFITGITVGPEIFLNPLEEIVLTVSMAATDASTWSPTELTIDILDPYGNQLTATFYSTSPADTSELISWNYVVNGFWGENPAGQWLIGLGDGVDNGLTGTLTELSMAFNTGQAVPEPSSAALIALVSVITLWIRRRFSYY